MFDKLCTEIIKNLLYFKKKNQGVISEQNVRLNMRVKLDSTNDHRVFYY